MSFKSTMRAYELLDDANVSGESIVNEFLKAGADEASYTRLYGEKAFTDVVRIVIRGSNGKRVGGTAPTLNIAGLLEGIGGRPVFNGLTSDGEGALVTLATALKLISAKKKGDGPRGDVVFSTHICPNTPTIDHYPVPYISCCVDFWELKKHVIDKTADAIITVDVSRGNRVIKTSPFAITCTIKEGWLLPVSNDALSLMERVTGAQPVVMPLSMQDITAISNGMDHVNDIGALPAGITAPNIGLALTAPIPLYSSITGFTNLANLDAAVRFSVEVARDYGRNAFEFYKEDDFNKLVARYGRMTHLTED